MAEHIVQRGETLSLIAARYGTTWQAIAQANRLANPNLIRVGQRLTIPARSTWASDPNNSEVWIPRENPFSTTGGSNQTQNNNQTTSNETTDAATLAALAAAKKKKEQAQFQEYLTYGGIALVLILVMTRQQ